MIGPRQAEILKTIEQRPAILKTEWHGGSRIQNHAARLLEARGLIRRTPSGKDWQLAITASGLEMLRRYQSEKEDVPT